MPSWLPENNTPLPQDPIERSLKKINDLLLISGGGGGPHTHDAADIVSGTLATVRLGSGVADATTFLRGDQTWAVPASGGAPVGAQYLVLATDATLTAERVLTGTTDQVILTDAGAGSTLTLSLPQSIATTSTPQFTRLGLGAAADANHTLLLSGGTITTDKHLLDAAVTWNDAGVTFTAIKLAVTSTLSAASSLLIDLQVGGVPKMSVDKAGVYLSRVSNTSFEGAKMFPLLASDSSGIFAFCRSDQTTGVAGIGHSGLYLSSSNSLRWTSGSAVSNAPDIFLFRDAANTLALRNTTTAQKLRVYNTFTTVTTSGEWFAVDWATTANVCNLWTVKGSSAGTARNLGLGTDGTQRWSIHATTGLLAAASGVELQLGNAAVAGATTPTHSVTLRDSTGTLYRVPCLV